MQELRLVGVHEDGEHLLLSSDGGATFRLRIDEALRSAAARPLGRPSTGGEQSTLSPRDIQARIRSGSSAEEIAAASGLPLANVLRYEGPVRAEREYIAQQAQKVEVATPIPGHDGYRSAFGDEPASLGEMVAYRLTAYGVDPSSVEWDSWRRSDGSWDVVARFELAANSQVAIGEEPPAQWIFSPARKTLQNTNRWAQLLSEIESMDGPLANRRLSAVADQVFDFEENGPEAPADDADAADAAEEAAGELLDVLRSRRGQRLGSDEEADDALALMLSRGPVPAAHPREGQPLEEEEPPGSPAFGGLSLAPSYKSGTAGAPEAEPAGLPDLHEGVSTHTTEITIVASPSGNRGRDAARKAGGAKDSAAKDSPANDSAGAGSARGGNERAEPAPEEEPAERKPIKPRRSSVPSWDEIVFGTKHD